MKHSERALQVWPVLAYAAKHRQTLTYADAADIPEAFAKVFAFD